MAGELIPNTSPAARTIFLNDIDLENVCKRFGGYQYISLKNSLLDVKNEAEWFGVMDDTGMSYLTDKISQVINNGLGEEIHETMTRFHIKYVMVPWTTVSKEFQSTTYTTALLTVLLNYEGYEVVYSSWDGMIIKVKE